MMQEPLLLRLIVALRATSGRRDQTICWKEELENKEKRALVNPSLRRFARTDGFLTTLPSRKDMGLFE